MITISREARELFHDRHQPIRLELPPAIRTHWGVLEERPSVRFGPPRDPSQYVETYIQGIRAFLPKQLSSDLDLRITLFSFLGFHWPEVEGWTIF